MLVDDAIFNGGVWFENTSFYTEIGEYEHGVDVFVGEMSLEFASGYFLLTKLSLIFYGADNLDEEKQ